MVNIEYEFGSEFNKSYSLVSRKILRSLSENSRITVSDLSKNVGVSRKTITDKLAKLEKDLSIRYTLELNEDAVGLVNPHVILVKFSSKPDYDYLKSLFEKSHIPQVVASIKGNYDLLVYANATSRQEYIHWDKSTQTLLSRYGVLWYTSEVGHRQLGFFPLRNELIERLSIPQKYKDIVKLLNINSRSSFNELSKQLGMHFNTMAYNFKKLLDMKYIKRFTILMKPVENVVLMTHFGKYVISRNFEEDAAKSRLAFSCDDPFSMISRYMIVSQLVGSFDLFALGAFDNADIAYRNDILFYKKAMAREKVKIMYGTVDKILVGNLPIRTLDGKKEYNTIRWIPELTLDKQQSKKEELREERH